jgi:hypothetical protein
MFSFQLFLFLRLHHGKNCANLCITIYNDWFGLLFFGAPSVSDDVNDKMKSV